MPQSIKDTPGRAQKLSLPLTAEGNSIDWDSVRPSTAQKVLELLKSDRVIKEELAEQQGGSGSSDDPGFDAMLGELTQENAGAFIDLVGKGSALAINVLASRFIKHPFFKDSKTGKPLPLVIEPDLLAKLKFSEEQHKELDPRVFRIAKKHQDDLPPWVKEHLDLIMLGLMFCSYTTQNLKVVFTEQLKRDYARLNQARATAGMAAANQPKPNSDTPPSPKANGVDHNPPPNFTGLTDEQEPAA